VAVDICRDIDSMDYLWDTVESALPAMIDGGRGHVERAADSDPDVRRHRGCGGVACLREAKFVSGIAWALDARFAVR
jgi:hypothetical protein